MLFGVEERVLHGDLFVFVDVRMSKLEENFSKNLFESN